MSSYIVTASTSVILIDSSLLTAGQSAVVYLSSQVPPGQNVTVRDSVGYLSTPQYILVSTTSGISFSDGTSSIRISDKYASLSFSSRDSVTWNIVNSFGFPLYNTIANVQSLTTSTFIGSSMAIQGSLSTSQISGRSFTFQSSSQVLGPAYVSSIGVGLELLPDFEAPPYAAYIAGSSYITSNVSIGGNLTVYGSSQFQSSIAISGSLGVAQGLTVGGDMTVQGNFQTVGTSATLTAQTANIQNSLTVLGATVFNSNVTVQSNIQVGGTTTLAAMGASTIQIASGGSLQLGTGPVLRARTDILPGQTVAAWNAPIYTPFLSSQTIQNTGATYLQNLVVWSTISAPTLQQFLLGSTIITNPGGNLQISSIAANTLTLSNSLNITNLQTSSIQVSSATVRDAITVSPNGYISCGTLYTSTLNVAQISTGAMNAGIIVSPSVRVSSLTVSQTIDGGASLSGFNMPSTTINNSQGNFITGALGASTLTTSSLFITSGIIQTNSNLTITAPTVLMNFAYVSSLTASTIQASTIQTTRFTVGAPTTATLPDFTLSSSSNVVITGGPGNYLTPYFLSNVIPGGQNPAVAYTAAAAFIADYKTSPPPPGLVIGYTARLFWAGETSSYLTIPGGPTLYGTYGSDQTASGVLSQSTFQTIGTLYGNSSYSISFGFQYSPNVNSLDSNSVIEFNNGAIRWNYALNATTIQNSLNDIATRNLYYYGSLNFASDPRIKEDIQDADLARCYETVAALPLRRYKYIDSYCSTFQVADSHRLGFLATDLLPHFPKSVHMSDSIYPEFSTSLLTIDTAQIEMAHLGATKYLMQEVTRLEQLLKARTKYDLVLNLSTPR